MSARERRAAIRRLFVSGVTAFALAAGVASAAEYTWNSTANGSFDDAARWSPAGGPPGAGDTAVFSGPALGGYFVTVPNGVRQINSLRVIGESVGFDTVSGVLQVNAAADDALLVRNDGEQRSLLGFGSRGSVSVPNGGITVSGTTGIPSSQNELSGGTVSADRVAVLGGVFGPSQLTVAHDVRVGNPGAARGAAPIAFFNAGRFAVSSSVGGVVRIHPDGSMSGTVTAAGGVNNAGRLEEHARVFGDLLNTGEFNVGDDGITTADVSIVDGDFVQTSDGVLRIRATRTNKPLLVFNSTIDLAGTIVFTPSPRSGLPQLNQRYPLIGTSGRSTTRLRSPPASTVTSSRRNWSPARGCTPSSPQCPSRRSASCCCRRPDCCCAAGEPADSRRGVHGWLGATSGANLCRLQAPDRHQTMGGHAYAIAERVQKPKGSSSVEFRARCAAAACSNS